MKNILSLFAITLLSTFTFGQLAPDLQVKGAVNSTWLLNKNISDKGAT